MKCEFEVNVLSTRPYVFQDKATGSTVEMTEIVFSDDEGIVYKTSKKGIVNVEGSTTITINIRSNQFLKPEVGVIDF